MTESIIVLSDLHIHDSNDPFWTEIKRFLERFDFEKTRIVFAGDIFDLYFYDLKIFEKRYARIIQDLVLLKNKGMKLDWIQGNHDFGFKNASHFCKIHEDSVELSIPIHDNSPENSNPKKIYIAHGDLVNRSDWSYLLLRKILRSFFMQELVKLLPDKWVDRIGSGWSKRGLEHRESEMESVNLNRLRAIYRNFADSKFAQGFDYVVLGHCHDLDTYETFKTMTSDRSCTYMNVGYPKKHRKAIYIQSDKIERLDI